MTEPIFEAVPRLPIVPPPWPGEALGSWLRAVAGVYDMPIRAFFARAGIRCEMGDAALAELVTASPSPRLLRSLADDLGVSQTRLMAMSLAAVPRRLRFPANRPDADCTACAQAAAAGAGRSVTLLAAYYPWRIGCGVHAPSIPENEIGATLDAPRLEEEAARVSNMMAALGDNTPACGLSARRKVAAEAVYWLAAHLNFHVFLRLEAQPEAGPDRGVRILGPVDRDRPSRPDRNRFATSLLAAWRLTTPPQGLAIASGLRLPGDPGDPILRLGIAQVFSHVGDWISRPEIARGRELYAVLTHLKALFRASIGAGRELPWAIFDRQPGDACRSAAFRPPKAAWLWAWRRVHALRGAAPSITDAVETGRDLEAWGARLWDSLAEEHEIRSNAWALGMTRARLLESEAAAAAEAARRQRPSAIWEQAYADQIRIFGEALSGIAWRRARDITARRLQEEGFADPVALAARQAASARQ